MLKSDFRWVIVRPSSKSNTFDKSKYHSLKGENKGGHKNEKVR